MAISFAIVRLPVTIPRALKGSIADLITEMTLRTIEVRERRDSFRPDIPVGIVGNGRQAGMDAALHPQQQFTHTRGLCGI